MTFAMFFSVDTIAKFFSLSDEIVDHRHVIKKNFFHIYVEPDLNKAV